MASANEEKVVIRPAEAGDRAAMQRVIASGMLEHGYEVSSHMDEDRDDLPEFYRRAGGEMFVLEAAGAGVVGTVAIGVMKCDPKTCVLRRMYLEAAWRGRGLGRQLVERAMDWARGRGYSRMELETAPEMVAAQRLYERSGFRREGDTRRFGRCGVSFSRDL